MTDLLNSLGGGAIIGLGASLLLLGAGRVAGISGIFLSGLVGEREEQVWRLAFVVGMLGTGGLMAVLRPGSVGPSPASLPLLVAAGLAVGFGTRMGGGCTSGHGVCGLARGSMRSLTATCCFMAAGAAAVAVASRVMGPL